MKRTYIGIEPNEGAGGRGAQNDLVPRHQPKSALRS